jgi:hypothetical protein
LSGRLTEPWALSRHVALQPSSSRTALGRGPGGAWRRYGPLALLLAARLVLGLAYSQVVPAWESFDEDGHFAYARYLAQRHSLVLRPGDPEAGQIWEKFQPPLYYDLIAPVIGLFDLGSTFIGPTRNPYLAAGDAGVNYALHEAVTTPAEHSIELALRAGRAAGVLISTLSVLPVFLTARRLWPREPAAVWTATVLYAFWPQFLFVGSMLTNDVLITAVSAAAVWLAVELVLVGFRLRQALTLSALVGLGLVTKLNGVALIILAGGALALSLASGRGALRRAGMPRLALGLAGLMALVAAAVWVLSALNFVTGQVLQLSVARDFVSNLGTGGQRTSSLILAALAYAFRTFLASYGWGNLETFGWLYWLWEFSALLAGAGAAVSAVAVVGARFGLALRRNQGGRTMGGPPSRVYWLLAVFTLMVVGLALALAVAQQNLYLVPGRYLLPALPAVVMLLAAGWRTWLPSSHLRQRPWQAVSLGLILAGWLVPFRILAPAYAGPTLETLGTVDTPLAVVYGNSVELLGYDGPVQAVAGDRAQVTLCWQALAPMAANHTLFLEVVGADGQGYGRLRTYPGHGNYPTSQWTPDRHFCERYEVPVAADIPAPALAHLRVSWLSGTDGQPLPVRALSGAPEGDLAYTIEFKVSGQPGYVPPVAHTADYRFGERIRLTGYEVLQEGSQVRVTLRWQALFDGTADTVVFVHLRDTPAHAYAQGDGPPLNGAYPTHLWKKGEVILDTHTLMLPAGRGSPPLDLYVGMVDASTARRLPMFDVNGTELVNDEVVLAGSLVFP